VSDEAEIWFDGAARGNPGPAAIGAIIKNPDGDVLATVSEAIGETTNNVAEYSALIAGLKAAAGAGARRIVVRGDSLLVVNQMNGLWKVKHANLKPLAAEARRLLDGFERAEIKHVRREYNTEADALGNEALDAKT
jgi:probable phosphoglycerate mutase